MLSTRWTKLRPAQLLTVLYGFLFAFVVVLACYIRLVNIYDRMQWFDDSARDMMVAKKIGESGQFGTVRPLAQASYGRLKNSTVYYNMLAFLWSFGRQRTSIIYGFAALGIISLFAGWEIGRQVGGKWLGLCCLFLLAISTTLAQAQISVYQRNLLPSLSLVVVMLAIWAWQCRSLKRVVVLQVFFTFGVLIHYALLTLAPAVAIVSIWVFWQHKSSLPKKSLVMGLSAIACFLFWLTTTSSNSLDLLSYASYTSSTKTLSLEKIITTHLAFLYDFIQKTYWYSLFGNWLTVFWMAAWALGAVICLRTKRSAAFGVYFLFLSTYFLTHLLFWKSALFTFGYDYMIHYQSLALLLIPLVIYELLKWERKGILFVALEAVCIIFFLMEFPTTKLLYDASRFPREAASAEMVTERITQDFEQLQATGQYQHLAITDYTSWAEPGWFLPAFLTFIEEKEGKSYASLRADHNNLQYHFEMPADVLYLICNKWRYLGVWTRDAKDQEQICLQPFMKNYLVDYMGVDPSEVSTETFMDSSQNGLQVNVFRITKKATKTADSN